MGLRTFVCLAAARAAPPAPAQVAYFAPVRTGQQALGMAPGITFANANSPAVGLGGNGAYLMSVSGTGITTANDDGIWANVGTTVYKLARNTDPIPSLPGVAWGDLIGKQPIANGAQVFFYAPLAGSATAADNESYWYGPADNLQLLVRKGDPV